MFLILAIVCLLGAVLSNGGVISTHSAWFSAEGLALLGLLFLALSGWSVPASWQVWKRD